MSDHFYAWAIYQYPDDYPRHWVVRVFHIGSAPDPMPRTVELATTIEEARKLIPIKEQGLVRMMPSRRDVPSLRETWV